LQCTENNDVKRDTK